ncbi:MAG: hypothetical protein JWM11_367 [Planctomycetaceae bacterium]|nr:hypothetical protein [Planctomycetaceae bacterium]
MSTGFEDFDIHEFIESFRHALSAPDSVQESALAAMLVIYGQQCDEANRRLRECVTLSQKGMYANAVALAEREPNLLDRSSALEIPERDILSTVATALGVKAPSLLNRDLIETLQETYQKGSSVESNLRVLHRLTLARAPLPTRLTIMRRLQIQDCNLPFIDADIRTFERTWFKRAVDFAQPFAKAGNAEVINEILNDLKENGYLETPPQQLLSALQNLLSKSQSLQLPILADEIKKAYAERAVALLKQLAARWKNLVAQTGIADATTKYQVGEALTWVNRKLSEESRETERTKAKSHLGNLLGNPKAKRQDVVAAYQAAHQLSAIDMMLEGRYELWTQAMNRRNFKNMIGIGIVALMLLGGSGIGYLQLMNSAAQSQDERGFIDNLKKLVQAKKFDAALDAGKYASPKLAENPQVVALLESARDGQKGSDKFAPALAALKDAEEDADLEFLERAAREVAKNDAERKQIDELVASLPSKSKKKKPEEPSGIGQEEIETRVAALLKKTNDLLASTQKGNFGPEQSELSEKYRQEFSKLDATARKQGLDIGGLTRVKTALDKVAPWKAVATNFSQFSTDMEAATASDESLKRTAEFLSSTLAKVHPEVKTQQRAKAAEKDLEAWKQALKLKDLLRTGEVDSKVRQFWLGKPPASIVDAALAPAEMLRHRDFARPDSDAFKLKTRLLAPDVKDVYCIRMELAEPYCYWYTSKPLEAGTDLVSWPVITDREGGTANQPIRGKRKNSELSPQSKLLPELEKLWTEATADNWHQLLADTYEKLAADSDIDPLLKLQIMRGFLNLAKKSSIGYRELLQSLPEFVAISGAEGVIDGNWYTPKNVLAAERTKATSLCDRAPHLAKIASAASERDKRAVSQTNEGIHLVGFLKQNHDGETTLAKFPNFTAVSDSTLYVVSEGTWIRIGTFPVSKPPHLDETANRFTGWPVFSVRNSDSAS